MHDSLSINPSEMKENGNVYIITRDPSQRCEKKLTAHGAILKTDVIG